MKLKKLTNKIYYFPHEVETDRPLLAYIQGAKFALTIDAGYSKKHVDDFYSCLSEAKLPKPNFTVITHWHYDHTFGMYYISGLSIAHEKTNFFLKEQQLKSVDSNYIEELKKNDLCFAQEYREQTDLNIVLSDIQFSNELIIDLGDLTAKIYHIEAPHSEDSVCVYIPEEKVLFLGDATSEDFFNNGYMDKNKLKKLIKMIKKTDCKYCILSHTDPLIKEDLLNYLLNLF